MVMMAVKKSGFAIKFADKDLFIRDLIGCVANGPSLQGEGPRSINVSTLQCTYMRTDIIGIYVYFFFVLKQDLDLLHENMKSVLFCFLRDQKRIEDEGQ